MAQEITVGLANEAQTTVSAENTAKAMGSGSLEVFATPAMCCLMEKAAAGLLESLLDAESTSVGISLQIEHISATPVGMQVTARAEITAVEGRKVSLKVTASDEKGEIGRGTHERFIVFREKFQAKANAKLA